MPMRDFVANDGASIYKVKLDVSILMELFSTLSASPEILGALNTFCPATKHPCRTTTRLKAARKSVFFITTASLLGWTYPIPPIRSIYYQLARCLWPHPLHRFFSPENGQISALLAGKRMVILRSIFGELCVQ